MDQFIEDVIAVTSDTNEWLKEHRPLMAESVRDGYDSLCDRLEALCNTASGLAR